MSSRLTGAHCGRGSGQRPISLPGVVPASRATSCARCGWSRVARLERGAGEVVARAGEEAAEAQHALERLRAVAGGGVEAAPELALGEPELGGQRLDAGAGIVQPRDRGRHGGIGGRGARARAPRARAPRAASRGASPPCSSRCQRRVAARRGPRGGRAARSAAARAPPRPRRGGSGCPSSTAPGALSTGTGPVSGPATNAPAPGAPDQVRAAVGQHVGALALLPRDPHPQAVQRARRRPLAVSGPRRAHSSASQT